MSKTIRKQTDARLPAMNKAEINDILTLCAAYDGHVAAMEAFNGVANQPRCKGILILNAWCDFHALMIDDVVGLLRTLAPKAESEKEERARVLTDFEFRRGASLKEVASLAASLAA